MKQNNVLEASVDNVKETNQQARASALEHSEAIKAQTFSAKAALKGLGIAGNMNIFAKQIKYGNIQRVHSHLKKPF